ncbi:hypothetical protein ACROYT_G032987 [Oculina patagonica]
MGRTFVALLLHKWSFFSLVFVTVYGFSPKILSVTRSKDKGDSFGVDFESYGCPSCEQYGAVSSQANGGISSGCSCQCSETKPTFYSSHSGQHGCVKDRDVLADTQGGNICDFYTGGAQQLQVLNLHAGGNARLKPNGFCEQVQITGWKFYLNTSWILSTSTTFYTISDNKGNNTDKLQTFLFWNDYLDSFYKGLLIKVMISCTYHGITDDRCLMLKAQGTHQYLEIPITTPIYNPTSSASPTTEKNKNIQKSTEALVEPTDSNSVPTGGYSKASDKQIWIAVSLGLAGLVLIIIIVITAFLWLKCRRNCKQERTGSLHHPAEQPSISAVCSPLHDYEYVHYPCLVEGARTPPVIPRGNPMYERGEDNKLIIWTPGHSGTLTRTNSQSADAAAPRLPYQRLLTRTSSSSPDCSATVGPLSPPRVEEGFPYQKLVRSVPSLRRDGQGCGHAEESAAVSSTGVKEGCPYQKLFRGVPSLRREEQACGETEELATGLDEERPSSSEAYQSLSLQRNPLYSLKECEGYAEVNSASRPESSSEYDYARVSVELDPVELNKLFRISHSETEEISSRLSMEISIGDLNNTTSNTNTDQKRHSGISKTSSTSSCSGDYENCTCKTITKGDSQSSVNRDDECVESKDLRPAASYEDLSGGCRLDPEEYVEMGKRKSMMIVESHEQSETEDGGHEYFVLEGLVESCEGETVDES